MKTQGSILTLLFVVICCMAMPAGAADVSYRMTEKGLIAYTQDQNSQTAQTSFEGTYLLKGKDNAMGTYIKSVKDQQVKSFLNDQFTKTSTYSGDFQSTSEGGRTESSYKTKEESTSKLFGVESGRKTWKKGYESSPTEGDIEDSLKKQATEYENDNKTSTKIKDHLKQNTKVKLYEKKFGQYSDGLYGYNHETNKTEGPLQILGFESDGSFTANANMKDGAGVEGGYRVEAIVAQYKDKFTLHKGDGLVSEVSVTPAAYAKLYAELKGDVRVSSEGVKAEGEAGAGAIVGVEAVGETQLLGGFIKLGGKVAGGYGAQAKAKGAAELSLSKIKLSGEAGLAWGFGGDLGVNIEIDPKKGYELLRGEVAEFLGDASKWYEQFTGGGAGGGGASWGSKDLKKPGQIKEYPANNEDSSGTIIKSPYKKPQKSETITKQKVEERGEVKDHGGVKPRGEIQDPGEIKSMPIKKLPW